MTYSATVICLYIYMYAVSDNIIDYVYYVYIIGITFAPRQKALSNSMHHVKT